MNLVSAVFPGPAGSSSVGTAFVTRAVTAFCWVWLQLSSKQLVSLSVCWLHCWNQAASTDPALLLSPVLLHCACFSLPGAMGARQVEEEMLTATLSLPLEKCFDLDPAGVRALPHTPGALCSTWSPQQLGQEDSQSVTHSCISPKLRLQNLSGAQSLLLQSQFFPCSHSQLEAGMHQCMGGLWVLHQQHLSTAGETSVTVRAALCLEMALVCFSCFLWMLLCCKLAKPPLAHKRGLQYLWQTLVQILNKTHHATPLSHPHQSSCQ